MAVDPEYIRELFSEFGAVQVRRMFGGAGLYADGVMFGLVTGGLVYLKADGDNIPEFERENCAPFEYGTKTGRRAVMSYWRMPDRLYDEPEELARWAQKALAIAQRSKSVLRKQARRVKKSEAKSTHRRRSS